MIRRRRLVLCISVFALSFAGGCRKAQDPETLIRAAIERTAKAAEARDTAGVMEIISEKNFKARGFDAREIRGIVFSQLRSANWQKVFLLRTAVALKDETHAKAETTAVLARGNANAIEDAIGANSGTYRFDLDFEKEGDDWKVVGVQYQRAKLENLLGLE